MKKSIFSFILLLLAGWSLSAQKAQVLKPGDTAPSFSLKDDQGKDWKSEDHIGNKVVVIYFYPAAMTSGCTAQACSYRDHMQDLSAYDVDVAGISGDYPEGLRIFRDVYNLNYTLLSDPEGKVARLFGVPVHEGGQIEVQYKDQKISLTRGVTEERYTFVIGKDGKILYANKVTDPAADSRQVLEVIKGER